MSQVLSFIIIALVFLFVAIYTDWLNSHSRSCKDKQWLKVCSVLALLAGFASFVVSVYLSL